MRKLLLLITTFCLVTLVNAQTTSSSSMTAGEWSVRVPFDIDDEGKEYQFMFGMGGWSWDFFAYQQRNHAGKENMQIARIGCTLSFAEAYTSLPDAVKNTLNTELSNTSQTGIRKVFFLPGVGNLGTEQGDASGTPTWSTAQRNNYVNNIVLAAEYIISRGYEIFGVAPFNEPDFEIKYTGNANNYNAVSAIMQTKPLLAGKIVGPSTLNSSEAPSWYTTVKSNINYANTHQLAGDQWSDYIGFWDQAYNDGKKPVADEMHNVMEAMVCINHGGVAGTWWGWDGITRGEYIRMINGGVQLNYKERPDEWMVASVNKYKEEGGRVEAFIGTSERQAVKSSFTFVSKDRLAYYDGKGPYYDYTQNVPGGAKGSYQNGQTNAERLIIINTGEDVPVEQVNGKYKIVSKVSGKLLSIENGTVARGNVCQYSDGRVANQLWDVYPVDSLTVPDFSYVVIRNSNTSSIPLYLDAQAWAMDNGSNVSVWSDGDAITTPHNAWQRWHLRYAGNGYYHVINHNTGLYLAVADGSGNDGANVYEWENDGSDKLLWKFVPADNDVDDTAPATPTGLAATGQSGSVKLTWDANVDSDIYGYMVYRYNDAAGIWECIGRKVKGTSFLDNTCRKGQPLRYKIKALDESYNLSAASVEVSVTTTSENSVVGIWSGRSLKDSSPNKMDAVAYGATFVTDSERASFSFDGTDDFVKFPYHAGDMQSMTFAAWVKPGSTLAWQRIFDFGNGEDEYLFLAARNGDGKLRFEIKKDGVVQGLDATTSLSSGTWTHVAVTIAKNDVRIYINGVQNSASTSISIQPSDVVPAVSYLGRSQFDADPAFKGLMSDVRIYNYPLTAEEIKALSEITTNTGNYDITAERIPNIADNVSNWDVTGSWTTRTSSADGSGLTVPYLRIGTSGTSQISKTLKYLPAGAYVISASCMSYYKSWFSESNATGITLFGNGTTTTVNTKSNKAAKTLSVIANVSADNTLKFGINADNTNATIIAMDNVVIKFNGSAEEYAYGIEDIADAYAAEAEGVVNKIMSADAKSALENALRNLRNATNVYCGKILNGGAGQNVADEWVEALEAMNNVVEKAKLSVSFYKYLAAQIDYAYEKESQYRQPNSIDSYGLADIVEKYEMRSYTDSEIQNAIEEIKDLTYSYLLEAATPERPVDITEFVVKSASFPGTIEGWTATTPTAVNANGLEYFNTNFNISQVLKDMPAGKYRFDMKAFYRYGSQDNNKSAYDSGTLVRHAKMFISDSEDENVADIMAISDDPSAQHEVGSWSSQLYGGNPVPDNMDAAGAAVDRYGKYAPANGYNSVTIEHATAGDITIGAKKETLVSNDWTFFGDVSLFYYGDEIYLSETADCLTYREGEFYSRVEIDRKIRGNDWSTLVVPFDMEIPKGWSVKELANDTYISESTLRLNFIEADYIEAGVPYLIRHAEGAPVSIPTGEHVVLTTEVKPTVTDALVFNGTFVKDVIPGGSYYISGNLFYRVKDGSSVATKGFRGYFTPRSSNVKAMEFVIDGETTAIVDVSVEETNVVFPADVYSLSGQMVRKDATDFDGLPSGVYIVGKKKIVVR